MKSLTYYFHKKTKILAAFHICISVPFNMFVFTAFFRFLNHILNLKALDQPQSAGEESLLTRDIK